MLLHDDVVYQILQWLPVISLLRFKLVCRAWRALIESNDFIKQHLLHHHYDPNLKDKNHSLIHMVKGKDKNNIFTFPLISTESFEEPNTCVQLDFSDLLKYFPRHVLGIVSYNGIVCLNLLDRNRIHRICLWNPATKQSRVLPQSPALTLEKEYDRLQTTVGVGFDVKNNDYKVVNLCRKSSNKEERVEVYSLNTDSWKSVTTVFPFSSWLSDPRVPFNNGTCFFWYLSYSECEMIPCFDFSFEKFRYISIPNVSNRGFERERERYAIVVSDKIAYVCQKYDRRIEIWVLNGYGSVNESWVKLYTINPFWTIDRLASVHLLWMNGNHLFFRGIGINGRSDDISNDVEAVVTIMAGGYNVVTKEIQNLSALKICRETYWNNCRLSGLRIGYYGSQDLVVFKESLLSVGGAGGADHLVSFSSVPVRQPIKTWSFLQKKSTLSSTEGFFCKIYSKLRVLIGCLTGKGDTDQVIRSQSVGKGK